MTSLINSMSLVIFLSEQQKKMSLRDLVSLMVKAHTSKQEDRS